MELTLFNTRTRRTEAFVPQDPARVTMYLCGPTVYAQAHIGRPNQPSLHGEQVLGCRRTPSETPSGTPPRLTRPPDGGDGGVRHQLDIPAVETWGAQRRPTIESARNA